MGNTAAERDKTACLTAGQTEGSQAQDFASGNSAIDGQGIPDTENHTVQAETFPANTQTDTTEEKKNQTGIRLRPYQEECIQAIEDAGPGRWLIAMSMGLGKCLAKGTPVLMADMTIRAVEDIRDGESVMGPDGLPRLVTGTAHGKDQMYRIHQDEGMDYTVNSAHILSLKVSGSMPVRFGNWEYKPGETANINIADYLSAPSESKAAAKGWKAFPWSPGSYKTYGIEVTEAREGEYYGFEIMGPDRLFLLGDFTVTHNTVIFSHLPRQGRTLILSHRDELVRQPEKYFDCSFGIEKAGEHSHGEEVVSASVQTLSGDTRLESFAPDAFDTIIVDEAHHAAAATYRKILGHFSGARRILGFTATPKRGDGIRLTDSFDRIIFQRDIRWGIENGYLCRVRSLEIESDMDLSRAKYTAGDYNQGDLEKAIARSDAIAAATKAYCEICQPEGKHVIIYCITKALCRLMEQMLSDMLPAGEAERTIRTITGETPAEERAEMLSAFAKGEVMCLINCMVLTEGTDLPVCDTIINIRPTCNESLYSQISGRALRLSPGKEYGLLIDICPKDTGTRTLCTAATLFGVDISRLDKKRRAALSNGSTDLLEECLDIEGICRDLAKSIRLRIEEVDRFLEESQEMIEESRTIGKLAQAIDKKTTERQKGAPKAFGELAADVQAADSQKYRITPIWGEEITFSEPDVLGNTKVVFHISTGTYNGEMKMEDAIELAEDYCRTTQGRTACMWDKEAQESWSRSPITDAQKGRIKKVYKKYDILTDGVEEIGRLSASRLIDLETKIKDMEKERKGLIEEEKRIASGSIGDNGPREAAEPAASRKEEDMKFQKFADGIRKQAEGLKRQREAAVKEEGQAEIAINLAYTGSLPASARQAGYAEDLLRKAAREKGDIFPGVNPQQINMTQAGILIGALLILLKQPGHTCREFYGMAGLLERMEGAKKGTYRLTLPYRPSGHMS